MMVHFCENDEWLLAINYFRKNAPPQVFDWVLNAPLRIFTEWSLKLSLLSILNPGNFSNVVFLIEVH